VIKAEIFLKSHLEAKNTFWKIISKTIITYFYYWTFCCLYATNKVLVFLCKFISF